MTSTILHLSPQARISEVQKEFSKAFPYLRLDFYRKPGAERGREEDKILTHSSMLQSAGLGVKGELEVDDDMTVAQLETMLLEKFGLKVQLARQSGNIWLETTMTDDWTLLQQNEHGREISHGNQEGKNLPGDLDLSRDDS